MNKKSSHFECSSRMFDGADNFDFKNSNEKDFEFARIANVDSIINGTCYELFYMKSKSGELLGYWGERNDSILFVPFRTEACLSSEFLILDRNSNGYFRTQNDVCFNTPLFESLISDGYFYKIMVSGENYVSLIFYASPRYIVNIAQNDYEFASVPLIMSIDFDVGVTFFSYDYYLDKQMVIPWVEQLLYEEFPPLI